jgi:hypothetical protein
MATDARHRRDVGPVLPRPRRRDFGLLTALVVGLVLAVLAPVAYWWRDGGRTTVETGTPPAGPVEVGPGDLLGVRDMKAVWPGPWAVLRTGEPADFERPLISCAGAVSPVPDPVSAQARWSIHAPPQSDGPALSQVLAAARGPRRAGAAVDRVRAWMAGCPPARAGETGTRQARVLRELPEVHGFLAEVRWVSPDSEAYDLVAVGRVDSVVVLLSYGEYGPSGLAPRTPEPGPVLDALDRAVDKLD